MELQKNPIKLFFERAKENSQERKVYLDWREDNILIFFCISPKGKHQGLFTIDLSFTDNPDKLLKVNLFDEDFEPSGIIAPDYIGDKTRVSYTINRYTNRYSCRFDLERMILEMQGDGFWVSVDKNSPVRMKFCNNKFLRSIGINNSDKQLNNILEYIEGLTKQINILTEKVEELTFAPGSAEFQKAKASFDLLSM